MTTQTRPGPSVRLEVRLGNNPPSAYEVGDGGFLVGSVPGCDLRLPGTGLAPVICLISKHAGGAGLRKLAPVQPITVNGRAVTSTYLADGDRLAIGALEIAVAVAGGEAPDARNMEAREQTLRQAGEALRNEQARWAKTKQELDAEIARQRVQIEGLLRQRQQADGLAGSVRADIERREQAIAAGQEELSSRLKDLEAKAAELARQDDELARTRRELGKLRQLYTERFQGRREKMIAKQQAVRHAARKIIERKQAVDAEEKALREAQGKYSQLLAEVEARAEQLDRERSLVDEQYSMLTSRQQEHQRELSQRLAEIHERERRLAEGAAALEKGQKQHKDDLVRLDRIQAAMDTRQKQLEQRALEIDKRFEQLQRDTRDLEDQARQMDEWHGRLSSEAEKLTAQKREQDDATAQAHQRAAALESQQTMLATLRTRLERMREEMRQQEQALADQRAMLAASEDDLRARLEEAERLRSEAANDKQLWQSERERFDARKEALEQAVAHLRKTQESFAAEQAELEARQAELDAVTAEQSAQAETLLSRGQQIEDLQARLTAEREVVRGREAALSRAEATLQTLQEQVRKRFEELNARQQGIEKGEAELRLRSAEQDEARRAAEGRNAQVKAELDELRVELTGHATALERRSAELAETERRLGDMRRRVEEDTQSAAGHKQAIAAERLSWDVERQAAREAERLAREEIAGLREKTAAVVRQLPELEMRANATLERLGRAREQLREHLAEVHGYARQSRDDLEAGRRHLQAEAERVSQQELELQVVRDEHRLAVAAFRQQLAEWQGKVGEMRQALQLGSTQLDMRRAEVEQQAKQAAAVTARLAAESAELQRERQQVVEKRGQMDRHLIDMREWYRKKLRDLAGVDLPPGEEPGEGDLVPLPSRAGLPTPSGPRDPSRAVLTMSDEIAPADRQLGELLRGLGLVDADTVSVLWADARRQRRTLRQLMLANGYLTLYQMALIEAGNLDALVLGPVRVIDKLPSTAREAAYRVFDPRNNAEALLRHLAETEMSDAVRPGEFRERFRAAMAVRHDHVAAVLEVFELQGRPAALCEWVSGLPSGDWPGLAAAPGAWYRLLGMAVLGLGAIHEQGLVHGHLSASSFVLSPDGRLKLTGLGEPPWLSAVEADESVRGDLLALGRVMSGWAATPAGGRAAKAKPLPDELQAILTRLEAGAYDGLGDLLADVQRAGNKVPSSAAAWERLVKHAADAAPAGMRRTA